LPNSIGDAGEIGVDCTIFRADGASLGDRETVVKILRRHFDGAEFGWTPSGVDKLAAMKSQGIEPPEILREHFLSQPAMYEGVYDGSGWSVQFLFGNADPIRSLMWSYEGKRFWRQRL
jgi:hypothetical protein